MRIPILYSRRPSEVTLVAEEVPEAENRFLEYVHQKVPYERGVLRASRPGVEEPHYEFFETHMPKAQDGPKRALERILEHEGGRTRTFRNPLEGVFSFTDFEGRTFDANVHDPAEKAVVTRARTKFNELARLYGQYLAYVQAVAARRVG